MLYLANISSNGNSSLGHSIVGAIAIDVNLPDFITIINHPSLRRVFPPPGVDVRLQTNFKGIDLFQENSWRVVQKYCPW